MSKPDLRVRVDGESVAGSGSPAVAPAADAAGFASLADLSIAGMHGVEPDFSSNGVWVGPRLQLPLPAIKGPRLTLTGHHFAEIFRTQNNDPSLEISVQLDEVVVAAVKVSDDGEFEISFASSLPSGVAARTLTISTNRYFVPAQLGESSDQRELCWRWKRLAASDLTIFDCGRRLNYFVEAETAGAQAATFGSLRFHLDAPFPGMPDESAGSFVVSGWAVDLAQRDRVPVRVTAGGHRYRTLAVDRTDVQRAFRSYPGVPSATGFSASVGAPPGTLPFQIQVRASGDRWLTARRGVAVAAPARAPKASNGAEMALARVASFLGLDGRSGADAGRARTFAQLPESYHFHLDAPAVDRKWVTTRCYVSGWAFDEDGPANLAIRVVVGDRIYRADSRHREDVQKAFAHLDSMPLTTGFSCTLRLPLGVHRLSIEVQRRDGVWIPVRHATVIRYPDLFFRDRAAPQLNFQSYSRRRRQYEKRWRREAQRQVSVMPLKPMFAVVIAGHDTPALRESMRSVREQIYPYHATLLIDAASEASAASGVGRRIDSAKLPEHEGDYFVFLGSGQTLMPTALYEFARAINRDPSVDLVYGDETVQTIGDDDETPFYKPAWSADYLETFNYIGCVACFRTGIVGQCIDDVRAFHAYDAVLRFTERTGRVAHVDAILGHDARRLSDGSSVDRVADLPRDLSALRGRLARTGRSGDVAELAQHFGCYDIRLRAPRRPRVSIVIPTAGKTISVAGRTIDLIVNVVEQILERSSYRELEIVVIDNGDLTDAQSSALRRRGCVLTTYREPVFNISKKLNQGVRSASGELLLLLNDDIELLRDDWIERMLEHFEKPHVGVVGGKLLYPDGRTQHVGVVHNSGNPDHVRRLFPRSDAGYFFSSCGVRNYFAVTGACMMTSAEVYRAVGGYSEELAVSYNDADFCNKVRSLGRTVVYAPQVELTHMESQSRVASADIREVLWYQERWAAEIVTDPFYNERFLTVASPTFVPCINERLV